MDKEAIKQKLKKLENEKKFNINSKSTKKIQRA